MNAAGSQIGGHDGCAILQHNAFGKGRHTANDNLFVPNGIQETPSQTWMLDSPPETAPDKNGSKGRVHN